MAASDRYVASTPAKTRQTSSLAIATTIAVRERRGPVSVTSPVGPSALQICVAFLHLTTNPTTAVQKPNETHAHNTVNTASVAISSPVSEANGNVRSRSEAATAVWRSTSPTRARRRRRATRRQPASSAGAAASLSCAAWFPPIQRRIRAPKRFSRSRSMRGGTMLTRWISGIAIRRRSARPSRRAEGRPACRGSRARCAPVCVAALSFMAGGGSSTFP